MTTAASEMFVWRFHEAPDERVDLVGGKGFGLIRMTRMGLPVPPGIIISTQACWEYQKNGRQIGNDMWRGIVGQIQELEKEMNKQFGNPQNPLLLSVRSGAPISMPGMMDTILNVGMTPEIAFALARESGNEAFGLDTALRFIKMFSETVLSVDEDCLVEVEEMAERMKYGSLSLESMRKLFKLADHIVEKEAGTNIPLDPYDQLRLSVGAVFDSWFSPRAITYRKANKIPEEMGTAVVIQGMVFGNVGADSGTGVAFTRNPITGDNVIYGEYLSGAQGEDVVAGTRTPEPLDQLKESMPETYEQLVHLCRKLESAFKDALDIEFTIEKGKVYLLQVRSAKRTPIAAVKIAVDLVSEGVLTEFEGLQLVSPSQIKALTTTHFDQQEKRRALTEGRLLCRGNPSSPGHVAGKVVLNADRAVQMAKQGEKVILVRTVTSPTDIHGMIAAVGIVTAKGGSTSHAAVVARALPRPCVTGCQEIVIDEEGYTFAVGGRVIREGDTISIDGDTGEVFAGAIPLVRDVSLLANEIYIILSWADRVSTLSVGTVIDSLDQMASLENYGNPNFIVCRLERLLVNGPYRNLLQRLRSDGYSEKIEQNVISAVSDMVSRVVQKGIKPNVVISLIDLQSKYLSGLLGQEQRVGFELPTTLADVQFIRAQLRGIDAGLKRTGNVESLAIALPRTQTCGEIQQFRDIVQEVLGGTGSLKFGAMVQTPYALSKTRHLATHSNLIILDLQSVFEHYYGIPIDVLRNEEIETYQKLGLMEGNLVLNIFSDLLAHQTVLAQNPGGCQIVLLNDSSLYDEVVESALVSGIGMVAVQLDQYWPVKLSAAKAVLSSYKSV